MLIYCIRSINWNYLIIMSVFFNIAKLEYLPRYKDYMLEAAIHQIPGLASHQFEQCRIFPNDSSVSRFVNHNSFNLLSISIQRLHVSLTNCKEVVFDTNRFRSVVL